MTPLLLQVVEKKNDVELVEEEEEELEGVLLEVVMEEVVEGEEIHHGGEKTATGSRIQNNPTVKQHLPSGVTRVSFVSSASVWRSIVWRSSATPAAAGAANRRSQFTFTASRCSEGVGRISRGIDGKTTETLKHSRCSLSRAQEELKPLSSSSAVDVWRHETPPSSPNCFGLMI